jgi:glycosyltransferase involved in cell wall biosynthesis/LmbE family N-acetylglucosaminyl deacetylase
MVIMAINQSKTKNHEKNGMTCENNFIPYEAVKNIGTGNVLVLAPHPDDEVFGCAGTIIRHVESEDPVHVIIVTDGGYQESDDSGSKDEYIRLRKEESIQAGAMLGYVPEFWNIPDREVIYGEKLISRISDMVKTLGIDLIYAPSVSEIHPDHRSLGMAAAEAIRRSDRNMTIAFYEIGIPLRPNHLLDITDVMALKREAMACFSSQLQRQKYDQHIAALNQFRTYTLPRQVQAAEAYFITNNQQLKEHPQALLHPEAGKITLPGFNADIRNMPLVTVMIRSIGRDKFLSEALASVALQTYPHIEILVINAKGEGHPELDPWCGRFPLRIGETGKPLSRSRAANLGLENAQGDYLIFLDDDDLFDPDHVSRLAEVLENKKNFLAAYAGIRTRSEGSLSHDSEKIYNDPFNPVRLFCHNYIPIHAVLFSRKIIEHGCCFDEALSLCEDWDFWIQVAQKTDFIHLDHVSATYRISDDGSNIWKDEKKARHATLQIFKKWVCKWSDDQLFTIAYQAGALHDYEVQAQEFSHHEQVQSARIEKLTGAIQIVIEQRDTITAERDSLVIERDALTAERNALSEELRQHHEELAKLYASKSWRLTAVFRKIRRVFTTTLAPFLHKISAGSARILWAKTPVPIERKLAFKEKIFTNFPFFFHRTSAYQNWKGFDAHSPAPSKDPTASEFSLSSMVEKNSQQYVPLREDCPYTSRSIRLIAFYLPQFHPIPENDAWWGEGFTEWTNVKAAKPQFEGHYQPHVPGELGYYDLSNALETQRRQVELARLYGLEGFCFYFYWFNGKQLLESPVLSYLEKKELDFPYCLCWANENWSRRWDGLDSEILIGQKHSPSDDLAFIEYISRYFQDQRYICIEGKPLLLVYRPGLLPSAKATVNRWRQWCRNHGIGEIYLAYTQAFEAVNPKKYGFDAAIEFPPNLAGIKPLQIREKEIFNPEFSGVIYDLSEVAHRSQHYEVPQYTLYRGVCPAWDNTARRKEKATIFVNNSPLLYQEWLCNAAIDTASRFKHKESSLVFVNAWNEWAEGAHLEPDQAKGYAYLQATRDALVHADSYLERRHILLVAHDAHPHGAQSLILHMAKVLHENFFFAVDMVVLEGGALLDEYARYATVHSLTGKKHDGKEARGLAADLFARGFNAAICNTTVTGLFVKTLKEQGFQVVSLIHELTSVINNNHLQPQVRSIVHHADCIVFPAQQVKEGFESFSDTPLPSAVIRPQGLFRKNSMIYLPAGEAKKQLLNKLELDPDSFIVLSIAFGDHRKGVDLFVEAGLLVAKEMENVYFVWVGHFDASMEEEITKKLEESNFSDRFIFPGMDFQSDLYYAGADLYALTSREDPFPNVVLEALNASTPVIAFDGTGGFTELLSRGTGSLVPAFDTPSYAREIISLLQHPEIVASKGRTGYEIINKEFSFRRYLFDLLDLASISLKRVSVIVPNYNYAQYLAERINSIVQQTYPIYELIILDDASTDESVAQLEKLIPDLEMDVVFRTNESNSGNPFMQWMKGVSLAAGDYIWIAEADDLSSPDFLKKVLQPFSDPQVVMSYCQSKQLSSSGAIACSNYLEYVADISSTKWIHPYKIDGQEEIRSALAIKNTIPNVSAVLFEKKKLVKILKENIDTIKKYRIAGDWLTYILVLKEGDIAFTPHPLNLHRRHQKSRTLGNFNIAQLEEILSVQKIIRDSFHPEEEMVKKALSYAQHLYKKFGLVTPETPTLQKNPKLSPYVEDIR